MHARPHRDFRHAEQCCDLAWRLNCDLLDASGYLVPVALANPIRIEKLCSDADGKFISAAYPGRYSRSHSDGAAVLAEETKQATKGRKIAVTD